MPIHDFQCPDCESVHSNIYVLMADIDTHVETCLCGGIMDFDFRSKTSRNTRSHKFPEFTAEHTGRLTGRKEEIHSIADIRRIEREHQDENVCFEAFSYDKENRVPDPVSKDEPVRMTENQKRDFVERFRDMNIKDERSARDY